MEILLQTSLPETIPELEAEVALLEAAQRECAQSVKELMAQEDVDNGIVFPAEIHALQQRKTMLETHRQHRQVRIRRLQMERELGNDGKT